MSKTPLKIVFTGPESSGKTTLSQLIAAHYQVSWIEEYARTYLAKIERPYKNKDLIEIAAGQLALEKQHIQENRGLPFVFIDTSILVIKVWSIFKYGYYNFELEKLLQQNLPDYYFLCDWNIPWEFDPLRENPNDRAVLYQLYKKELQNLNTPFFEVKGSIEERKRVVIEQLSKLSAV